MQTVTVSIDQIKTKKQATSIHGGLSNPSKMPGLAFGLPASECKTGSKLREIPGSVCHGCYAHKGRYTFDNVQSAQYRRFNLLNEALATDEGRTMWKAAIIRSIGTTEYFRVHDSGDIQSVEHLRLWIEIAEAMPKTKFWIPTKEKGIVRTYMRKYKTLPDNLTIRLSGAMIDGQIPSAPLGIQTSTVHKDTLPKGIECDAYQRDGTCGACRNCWDKGISNISYPKH